MAMVNGHVLCAMCMMQMQIRKHKAWELQRWKLHAAEDGCTLVILMLQGGMAARRHGGSVNMTARRCDTVGTAARRCSGAVAWRHGGTTHGSTGKWYTMAAQRHCNMVVALRHDMQHGATAARRRNAPWRSALGAWCTAPARGAHTAHRHEE